MLEAAIREGSQQPEYDFQGGVRAGGKIQSQRRERGGKGVDGDAGENQGQRAAAAAGQQRDQRQTDDGPGDPPQGQSHGKPGGCAGVEHQHGAEGSGRRGAHQARLRQGISQVALQGGTGETQGSADHRRQKRPGQPDLVEDQPQGVRVMDVASHEQIQQRGGGSADEQRCDEQAAAEEREQRQHQHEASSTIGRVRPRSFGTSHAAKAGSAAARLCAPPPAYPARRRSRVPDSSTGGAARPSP